MFTGDEFADGGDAIREALKKHQAKASFFLTGRFYRNPAFRPLIQSLKKDGHYLGAHSDKHLLYCDWQKRDSLLVTQPQFAEDLQRNYQRMAEFGIHKKDAPYFLPPYEWYNRTVTDWTEQEGLQLVNFSPGTRSAADYTWPEMGNRYVSSETILKSILAYEAKDRNGLNGFLLLLHIGTDPRRQDKFYHRLDELLTQLEQKGYRLVRIDELLEK
ncbi:polysaccharide deacetylase family protein [Pontibacter roseus]|uniref:polysaccharide deacetylase family protein n=1 Tax=Pontibacter roseus TaxID=336989 RepID=UPI00039C9646|nr:polysaccharide deacetylase family protein [Pontibacter roseus]